MKPSTPSKGKTSKGKTKSEIIALANIGPADKGALDMRTSTSVNPLAPAAAQPHKYGKGLCSTDTRGFATPQGRSPLEIVVDSSEGFIPLWAQGKNLRWRFNASSMSYFENPEAAKNRIRTLFAAAVQAWGSAAPVAFSERNDAWDFEVAMSPSTNCNTAGCTLARAFFPDAGRHDLLLFPTLFEQSEGEQVETLVHEVGHIFGLRHFFAPVSETAWASEIFGTHSKFSIMNYGADSKLTQSDKDDLTSLYRSAWDGKLTEINGTKIRFVQPYHEA